MKDFAIITIALLGFGAAAGCVEKSSELTAAEREQISQFVSTSEPSPEHALDVSFENKVLLLGYDVSAEEITPGQPITITWYWKSEQALEEGWRMFTHVADADGNNRLNADGGGVIRDLYQPGRWKSGEYIKDEHTVTIPADWNSPRATFYVGIWNGPHRLQVSRGPADDDNRARALMLNVGGRQPERETPPPAVLATRLPDDAEIELDGKLDEEAWASAPATGRFVNTLNGSAAEPVTTAKLLWDDTHLYVGFDVADDFLKSEFEDRDDHLWEQDCVEIMINPSGDGRNYFEMQVAPTGVIFDTRYDTRRQPQPIGHADWNSGLEAGVDVRGTVNDDEADQGYSVEIKIPWTAFAHGEPAAQPPGANATWRMNFYVMDERQEGERSAGWSPTNVSDFHVPNRFGRVTFRTSATAAAPTNGTDAPQIALPPSALDRIRQQVTAREALQEADPTATGMTGMPDSVTNPRTPRPSKIQPTAMEPAPTMEPAPSMQ